MYTKEPKKKLPSKLPSLDSKVGKYFVASRVQKKNHKESAAIAGYSSYRTEIEHSSSLQALERHFKDVLLDTITLPEIAEALKDNILQLDENGKKSKTIDRSSRNTAISIAIGKIEPEKIPEAEDAPTVIILQ